MQFRVTGMKKRTTVAVANSRVSIPLGDTSLVNTAWSDTDLGFDPTANDAEGYLIVETSLGTIRIELPMTEARAYRSGLIRANDAWQSRAVRQAGGGNNLSVATGYDATPGSNGAGVLQAIYHYKTGTNINSVT